MKKSGLNYAEEGVFHPAGSLKGCVRESKRLFNIFKLEGYIKTPVDGVSPEVRSLVKGLDNDLKNNDEVKVAAEIRRLVSSALLERHDESTGVKCDELIKKLSDTKISSLYPLYFAEKLGAEPMIIGHSINRGAGKKLIAMDSAIVPAHLGLVTDEIVMDKKILEYLNDEGQLPRGILEDTLTSIGAKLADLGQYFGLQQVKNAQCDNNSYTILQDMSPIRQKDALVGSSFEGQVKVEKVKKSSISENAGGRGVALI